MDLKSYIDIELRTTSAQQNADALEQNLNKVDAAVQKTEKSTKQYASTTETSLDKVTKASKEAGDAGKAGGEKIADGAEKAAKKTHELYDASENTRKKLFDFSGVAQRTSADLTAMVAKKVAVIALFVGIKEAVVGAINVFKDFDQNLADLSAITGARGDDLEFYAKQAREIGSTTTQSAAEVVKAFQYIGSAKPELMEAKESLAEVTKEAIRLAEAGGTSVEDAANTMASALNQFGEEADQAARFVDVLAAGSKFGAAEIGEVAESMKVAGVAAANFRLSFEDANAAIQILSLNSLKGSEAGTKLRGVILGLETKGIALGKAFGVELRPSVVGIVQAMENLNSINLDATQQMKLFGAENLVAGQILSGNSAKLAQMIKDITGTSTATEQAATRTDTFEQAQKRFGNALDEVALKFTGDTGLGRMLTNFINDCAQAALGLGKILEMFETAAERAGRLQKEGEGTGKKLAKDLDLETLKSSLLAFNNQALSASNELVRLGEQFDRGAISAKKYRDESDKVKGQLENAQKQVAAYGRAITEWALQEVKVTAVKRTASAEVENYGKKVKSTILSIKQDTEALGMNSSQLTLHNALVSAGVSLASEEGQAIKKVVDAYNSKAVAIENNKKILKDLQQEVMFDIAQESKMWKESDKAAKEAAKSKAKEVKAAMEQIEEANKLTAEATNKFWEDTRSTLSDFFFEFARDGMNAFDTLVEGFKAMIVKMIAEAAANQIILGVTAVLGGTTGTAAQAAQAVVGGTGGAAGLSGTMSMVNMGKNAYSNIAGMFGANAGAGQAGAYTAVIGDGGAAALGGAGGATGFAGSYAGMYNSMSSGLNAVGLTGMGDAAALQAMKIGNMSQMGAVGYGVANLGAGFIGGYAGSKVFGETTGVGSTLGGAVGSFWGPLGTAAGSFIGAGIEKGLSKVFGWKEGGNNAASGTIDFKTGETTAKLDGKNGGANQTAVEQIQQEMLKLSAAIGGSEFSANLKVGNKDGLRYNGGKFSDIDSLLDKAFEDIVKNSKNVDDALEEVILGFKGTREEMVAFAQTQIMIDKAIKAAKNLTPEMAAMARQFQGTNEDAALFTGSLISLTDILSTNGVEDALTSMADAQKTAADGIIGAYNRQVDTVIKAIQLYDGSAASMADLNNAMVLSKQSAFDLTMGVMNLKLSMTEMFAASAQSIREQLMTEVELAKSRVEQRDALRASIDTMMDPEQIRKAGEQIDALNMKLFNALNPKEKEVFGEQFATYEEDASKAIAARLDAIVDKTKQSQEALMATTGALLKESADKNVESSKRIQDAAEAILKAAAMMPKTITVIAPPGATVKSDTTR